MGSEIRITTSSERFYGALNDVNDFEIHFDLAYPTKVLG